MQLRRGYLLPPTLAVVLAFITLPLNGAVHEKNGLAGDAARTIELPGGFEPIARILGLDGYKGDPAHCLERIFSSILDGEPPPSILFGVNPKRADLDSYFKEYADFLQFLLKNRLIQPGMEPAEIRFPLSGQRATLEITRKLFSFFGISSRVEAGNRNDLATVVFKDGMRASSHAILYRALALNLQDGDLREIRISPGSQRLPIMPEQEKWERIFSGRSSAPLFQQFVEAPKAMRLYLALATCSPQIRVLLLDSVHPEKLLKSSGVLSLFGSELKSEHGTLTYPGVRQAWTGISASNSPSLDALFSNSGIPLLFYSVVSAAPSPVQEFLTASPERLQSYVEVLQPYASRGLAEPVASAVSQDLRRIFRMSVVTPNGLTLSLNQTTTNLLLKRLAPDQAGTGDPGFAPLTPKILARFLPKPGASPYFRESRANTLELFRFLEEAQPKSISEESIVALLKIPEDAPVFLDLIGDLAPSPALLSKYLDYCTMIAAGTNRWNVNRMRTSQSIFFLISALRRQGTISQQKGLALLGRALQAFSPDDEGQFALNASRFLSTELIPELSRRATDSNDPILSALSGKQKPSRILYQDRELVLDLSAQRYRRMVDTLNTQSCTPIAVLLDLYSQLDDIRQATDAAVADIRLGLFSERLSQLRTAEWTPGDYRDRPSMAQAQVDAIKREITSPVNWTGASVTPATLAGQVAAQLHVELGITLLGYCYAYSGAPDINVLFFDPNFLRKHRFDSNSAKKPTWSRAHFVQEGMGGWMEGSLAGLGFELTRLQIAQSSHDFGISQNNDVAPAILFGIRQVRPEVRTDRSQEYVALVTGLGQNLLSLASANGHLRNWIEGTLRPLLSQRRLDEIINGKNTSAPASELVSRSEMFLLGQDYFNSGKWKGTGCPDHAVCSAIDRLSAIIPKPGSEDYNAFQEEVSRFGVLLCSRTGLSRFSFDMVDSYEGLARSLHPQYLYERICDLKIRIAELNYALGLPAALEEIEGELALPLIMAPASQAAAGNWEDTIERINSLTGQAVLGWVDELMSSGLIITELKRTEAPDQ